MDKSALKKYAPRARNDFIAAVTRRAETLGLNPEYPATIEQDGDALLIDGRPFPAALKRQRDTLQQRIEAQGFDAVMEAIAYTWFNRLVAIRYMELHDFLGHGYRVLSHPQGHTQPEILEHAADIELDGLDRQRALELKLAGNRDEELYRDVLLAQCHALHVAMPFLFESIDDATELLLPDGLLRTDSLVRDLVTSIDETSWQEVEIIGWLYQFYISERKDQVIGKVVKSEDIPAATQLFTPNWIVKYLVQNSLGRLWLMANPGSQLATKWDYYIEPAEQTPEVNAQLDELIQTRIAEDGNTLNPESLTLLDPACGSGHILVEAYDLLRDIYLERGYRKRDIPRLILENNLHGLDIDDRAAQLSGFALLMKARADDRRLFSRAPGLNVHALQQTAGNELNNLPDLSRYAQQTGVAEPESITQSLRQLVQTFAQAKTFGSLIQIPDELAAALPALQQTLAAIQADGGLFERDTTQMLLPVVAQAKVLAGQYDAVVANPPYMGGKYMAPSLKSHVRQNYPAATADLFASFILRGFLAAKGTGICALVTLQSWMFYSTLENIRRSVLTERSPSSLIQIGYNSFPSMNSKVALAAAECFFNRPITNYVATYFNCNDAPAAADKEAVFTDKLLGRDFFLRTAASFDDLPGAGLSFWADSATRDVFKECSAIGEVAQARQGLSTSDNTRFVRRWQEVSVASIQFDRTEDPQSAGVDANWVPYNKGGLVRRWYGNNEHVVFWKNDGELIKSLSPRSVIRNPKYYFLPSVTWSDITIDSAFRLQDSGFVFANSAHSAFCNDYGIRLELLGILNSPAVEKFIGALSQSLHFDVGYFNLLPFPKGDSPTELVEAVRRLVELGKWDWDSREVSWGFTAPEILTYAREANSLVNSFALRESDVQKKRSENLVLEAAVARLSLEAYGLEAGAPTELDTKYCVVTSVDRVIEATNLLSYTIGCMLGRYSLDEPGLIYAHAGNEGFDPSRYTTFPADEDGIVPTTDQAWFDDDGASRVREFVRVVWGTETEDENMAWLAESLGSKRGESADDTIRRYLSTKFYKDHLKTYKKRPIYWLFSSGKQKAFEALVYLHRYNAGTLSRMRMEYVVPLQSRMQSRIESLDQDIPAATSSAETKRLQKQRDKLAKQLDELRHFDERLRHYADQRITLDLDDGVKVNYGKFGDLLADVKAVTGKKPGS